MKSTWCAHCQRPLDAGAKGLFCCVGCETVYGFIQNSGLEDYYLQRDQACILGPALKAEDLTKELSEIRVRFKFLDDPGSATNFLTEEDRLTFHLQGLHCSACLWLLDQLPRLLPGVGEVKVDLGTGLMGVSVGSFSRNELSKIPSAIIHLGYGVRVLQNSDSPFEISKTEQRKNLIRLGVAAAISANLMIFAIAIYAGAVDSWGVRMGWISGILFLPAILYCALPFYQSCLRSLKSRKPSIDLPIILAILVGTVYSYVKLFQGSLDFYFDSIAALLFLLLASRQFLFHVQARVWKQTQALASRVPLVARRGSTEVEVSQLRPGDVIEVQKGEWIAGDGEVLEGSGYVSFAQITGEPSPRPVKVGEKVFGGTELTDGLIRVRVQCTYAESHLGRLIEAARKRLFEKTALSEFSDRLVNILVLGVTVGFFAVLLHFGFNREGFDRALAMLIVTCPCAFALATPLTKSLGMARALSRGMLLKSPAVFERLRNPKHLLWDKTGTLSTGNYKITSWNWKIDPKKVKEASALIAGLEAQFKHPVGHAILSWIQENVSILERVTPQTYRYIPGRGVEGTFENQGLLKIENRETRDRGVLEITANGMLIAEIELSDQIREDAFETVECLKKMKVSQQIVSGDDSNAVNEVAQRVGLESQHHFSKQTPEEKLGLVNEVRADVFVGDGINDVLALSAAKVGIALTGGVQSAFEGADVSFLKSSLMQIPELLTLSKRVWRVLIGNLGFSVTYNLVGLTASILGWVSPLFAAFLMPASALTVFGWNWWMLGREEK